MRRPASGSASTISNAASRASSTSSRSRRSDASLRSLRPFWAVDINVPSPRSSRSTSASSNPSVEATSASTRGGCPRRVCCVTSQHREACWPRPTRPRSWCSWAIPNRSASRITITVALGTSTPTSITVVATSTSSCPARNSSIVISFSAGVSRPCSRPSRRPFSSPASQPLVRLLGGRHLELLALVDQRAHDVRLTARRRPRRERPPTPPLPAAGRSPTW